MHASILKSGIIYPSNQFERPEMIYTLICINEPVVGYSYGERDYALDRSLEVVIKS